MVDPVPLPPCHREGFSERSLKVLYNVRLPAYDTTSRDNLRLNAVVYFFSGYFKLVQCFAHVMISLNRYTAVVLPARHAKARTSDAVFFARCMPTSSCGNVDACRSWLH